MAYLIYLFSYLLGSISFSYVLVKLFRGEDIRRVGSKNPGATNVIRTQGLVIGLVTVAFDILKGSLACFISKHYGIGHPLITGFFCVLGHCFPVFLSFKGGKGVATSVGVLGFLYPHYLPLGIVIFFVVVLLTKYVSLGSLLVLLIVNSLIIIKNDLEVTEIVSLVGILCLVYFRHKDNIKRLIAGNENKFTIGRRLK